MRPLEVGHLAVQLRLHPGQVAAAHARHLRDDRERAVRSLERTQQPHEAIDLGVGQPGAHVARPDEPVGALLAQHERADRALAPALPVGEAHDRERLLLRDLDLHPGARPPIGLVAALPPLRDDALDVASAHELEQPRAVVERARDADRVVRAGEQRLERLAPLGERPPEQRRAIQLEQVERVQHARAAALLEEREARPPLLVDRTQLAVDDRVVRAHRCHERGGNARIAPADVVTATAPEHRLATADARDDAHPVPLDLVLPLVAHRQHARELREHRARDGVGARDR